jgi:diadenylate cyclase
MTALLRELLQNVRLADLLDVALVSAALYAIITWMRRSASKRVMAAVALFVLVYGLARAFEMYLTKMLIEALLAVVFIAAIIVFQADIRRGLDQIGSWLLWRRSSRRRVTTPVLDVLAESAANLAEEHVGALVAVKGREPWDRLIEGGIALDGLVSRPLLQSIFDPNSPGHDGAALIERDKVTKFGAHLPLSTNLDAIEGRGTRHAAAVGLSEQCDALVIVVSEERGCISVAQHGTLTELDSAGELKNALDRFWRARVEPKHDARRRGGGASPMGAGAWWRRPHLQTGLLSVVLACVFWFMFAYRSTTVYRTYAVPIDFRNLEPDQMLEGPIPLEARVTLAGSEQAFRLLDPASLRISIDLASVGDDQRQVTITRDNIRLPADVKIYQVEPRVVPVRAQRLREVQAAIEVATAGELPIGRVLMGLTPEPRTLTLLVPTRNGLDTKSEQAGPIRVLTEPIDLSGINQTTEVRVKLEVPSGSRIRFTGGPGGSGESGDFRGSASSGGSGRSGGMLNAATVEADEFEVTVRIEVGSAKD